MNSLTIETVANLMQMSIPLLSLTAYIPQWIKLFKNRSSENISLQAWSIWILSGAFACFYALVHFHTTHTGLPLVISSITNIVFVTFTVVLIVLFRKKKSREAHTTHH